MEDYNLEMPFLTDNPKWIEGFECGMLYAEIMKEIPHIENYYHNKNIKQIKAMAEQYEYFFEQGDKQDGWTKVTLTKDIWDDIIE